MCIHEETSRHRKNWKNVYGKNKVNYHICLLRSIISCTNIRKYLSEKRGAIVRKNTIAFEFTNTFAFKKEFHIAKIAYNSMSSQGWFWTSNHFAYTSRKLKLQICSISWILFLLGIKHRASFNHSKNELYPSL